MRVLPIFVVLGTCLVTACGGSSSGSGADAATDTPPTGGVKLSGTVKEIAALATTPHAGVTLTAYNAADDSVLGTATSAADGTFTLNAATGGAAIQGYLKATTPGGTGNSAYKDSYLYPPTALSADYAGIPVYILTVGTYGLANTVLGITQDPANGWLALVIEDAAAAPVAGAVVTSTPAGQIAYNVSGRPSMSGIATEADGIAYDTNVPPGQVTVSATKTGTTFASHAIKVRPDVVTLTLVTP